MNKFKFKQVNKDFKSHMINKSEDMFNDAENQAIAVEECEVLGL